MTTSEAEKAINENFQALTILVEHLIAENAMKKPNPLAYIHEAREQMSGPNGKAAPGAKETIKGVYDSLETRLKAALAAAAAAQGKTTG
ncbi:MAG: hypothetical protein NVV72_01175 [Asticcacaulis sp.]|nr:hypothetical protein [Asticcacaulis sp.]